MTRKLTVESHANEPETLVAGGVLIVTRQEPRQFLLLRHTTRWDLPKGHAEAGETPRQAAVRETEEETGLSADDVELDPEFEFVIEYPVQYPGQPHPVLKRAHYFIGWIAGVRQIHCTEHEGWRWFDWTPPHRIQEETIDPLLDRVEYFWAATR